MRQLTWQRCSVVALLWALLQQAAWAGPIKDFIGATDGVIWGKTESSGSVLSDATNNVATTSAGDVHKLLVTNAQNLTGEYSFTFSAGLFKGDNRTFIGAYLTAMPDTSNGNGNGPGPVSTGSPNLKIATTGDFTTVLADIDGLTTGPLDLTGLNVSRLFYKVTASVNSPLEAFAGFEFFAETIQAPPPPPPVPEPSTWGLLAVAGATLTLARRRR
jgi:hypothetical protein